MSRTKPFWLSKTVWAAVITLVVVIAKMMGVEIAETTQADMLTVVMLIATIISRWVAKDQIGLGTRDG